MSLWLLCLGVQEEEFAKKKEPPIQRRPPSPPPDLEEALDRTLLPHLTMRRFYCQQHRGPESLSDWPKATQRLQPLGQDQDSLLALWSQFCFKVAALRGNRVGILEVGLVEAHRFPLSCSGSRSYPLEGQDSTDQPGGCQSCLLCVSPRHALAGGENVSLKSL